MIQNILIVWISAWFLLLPLVFWLYIFTQFSYYPWQRFQFFGGIMSGIIISVLLVGDNYFPGINIFYNLFEKLTYIQSTYFWENVFIILAMVFLFFWILFFILQILFKKNISSYKKYSISYIAAVVCIFLSLASIKLTHIILWDTGSQVIVRFQNLVFYTFASITWYYIIIALIEETTKFIAGLWFYADKKSIALQQLFCISISVALWFSFCENILYVIYYIAWNGIDSSMLSLSFFRSIFAVNLHIFASILMVFSFSFVLLSQKIKMFKILLFFILSILAILSHSVYDLALTFGYPLVMFLYIIGIYLFVSYIFFRESI